MPDQGAPARRPSGSGLVTTSAPTRAVETALPVRGRPGLTARSATRRQQSPRTTVPLETEPVDDPDGALLLDRSAAAEPHAEPTRCRPPTPPPKQPRPPVPRRFGRTSARVRRPAAGPKPEASRTGEHSRKHRRRRPPRPAPRGHQGQRRLRRPTRCAPTPAAAAVRGQAARADSRRHVPRDLRGRPLPRRAAGRVALVDRLGPAGARSLSQRRSPARCSRLWALNEARIGTGRPGPAARGGEAAAALSRRPVRPPGAARVPAPCAARSPTSRPSTTTSAPPTPGSPPSASTRCFRQVPVWQPILLGGIWQQTGGGSWAHTDKRDEGMREVERRAESYGLLPVRWPDGLAHQHPQGHARRRLRPADRPRRRLLPRCLPSGLRRGQGSRASSTTS